MPMPICDVCGREAIGVASSSLGAVSWAFCAECVHKPAEPLSMFAYMYDEVSDEGQGLIEAMNDFYTWIDGAYVSWPDYVKQRRARKPGLWR